MIKEFKRMRILWIFFLMLVIACQGQKKQIDKIDSASAKQTDIAQSSQKEPKKSDDDNAQENARWKCNEEVCLQLRNLNSSNKTFEIYMMNSVPIFGFQCDLPGVEIINASGGLLTENDYQTSNSESRLLSFSLKAKAIPVGMGVLTNIQYDNPTDAVCMTGIIFAGIGGSKLSNNEPECMKLN